MPPEPDATDPFAPARRATAATPAPLRTRAQVGSDEEGTLHGVLRWVTRPSPWAIPADADEDERHRAEVLIVASFVLGLTALLLDLLLPFGDGAPGLAWVFLPALPWHVIAGPVLYRRFRSLALSASLQASYILWSVAFLLVHEDGERLLWTPWLVVIPLYAMYVGGRTVGLVFTVLTAALAAVGWGVQTAGLAVGPPLLPSFESLVFLLGDNVSLLILVVIGYLYESTRERSSKRLGRTIDRLRESEASLVAVFDNMADGIAWIDDDLSITMLNAGFQDLLEVRSGRRPAPGTPLLKAFPDHQQAIWVTRCARALAGTVVEATDVIGEGDGQRWHEVSLAPLSALTGRRGFTVFVRDVTERMQADDRLRQANRRLVLLSRKAGMADQATGLLHDLRNALNGVFLAAGLVREGLEDLRVEGVAKAGAQLPAGNATRIAEYLVALGRQLEQRRAELEAEAAHMATALEHVGALLQAQQAEARAPYAVRTLPLEQVVESALAMQAPLLAEHGIEVIWEDGGVGEVSIDRHRVLQILGNLLRNAVDALSEVSGRPRRLWVRTLGLGPEAACVEIRDNGRGFPAEHASRLFQHGFTTKADGHGFGLHAAASAARDLGGQLGASSEGVDRGATFELKLPTGRAARESQGA